MECSRCNSTQKTKTQKPSQKPHKTPIKPHKTPVKTPTETPLKSQHATQQTTLDTKKTAEYAPSNRLLAPVMDGSGGGTALIAPT